MSSGGGARELATLCSSTLSRTLTGEQEDSSYGVIRLIETIKDEWRNERG
jgi:hypothetical protein